MTKSYPITNSSSALNTIYTNKNNIQIWELRNATTHQTTSVLRLSFGENKTAGKREADTLDYTPLEKGSLNAFCSR